MKDSSQFVFALSSHYPYQLPTTNKRERLIRRNHSTVGVALLPTGVVCDVVEVSIQLTTYASYLVHVDIVFQKKLIEVFNVLETKFQKITIRAW